MRIPLFQSRLTRWYRHDPRNLPQTCPLGSARHLRHGLGTSKDFQGTASTAKAFVRLVFNRRSMYVAENRVILPCHNGRLMREG